MKVAHVLAAMVIAIASMLAQPAIAGAGTQNIPKFIRIPVFYVTDRNRLAKSKSDENVEFGRERRYLGLCKHEMYMGVAYCSIANTEHKSLTSCMQDLEWTPAERSGEGPRGIALVKGNNYADSQKKFFDQVYQKAVKTSDQELFMFTPGYMSTFESGLRSAARLSYYAERPVLLYSWPSRGRFTEYFADEATIEWTQEHFNTLLGQISDLAQRTPAMHARLYSHSMGGRLVLRATPLLKTNKALREVTVVCPDVDDGVVKHYAESYFDGKGDLLVRLYISKRDYMLRLSQLVHGGYARLGEDRQPLDTLLPKNAAKLVDIDTTGAEPQYTCPESLQRRLLTIDFTAVDIGTLGHRIPVEVLCGLSQTGQPGGNLKLSLATPKGVKPIGDEAGADSSDGIVRLVKPGWRGTPILGTLVRYRPRLRLLLTRDWSLK